MNLPKIAKFTRLHPDCGLQRVNFKFAYKLKAVKSFFKFGIKIVFLLGREGGLNCEVAPLPAPNHTHPPTTLAVQAAPEFNSNETNRRKISRIAIQILLKFRASVARHSSVARVGQNFKKSWGRARLATLSAAPLRISRIMHPGARLYP